MQSFPSHQESSLGSQNTFTLNDKSLEIQKIFTYASVSSNVDGKNFGWTNSRSCFVGIWSWVPATTDSAAFSSYKDIDVQGKWIADVSNLPENFSFKKQHGVWLLVWCKLSVAKMKGAKVCSWFRGPIRFAVLKNFLCNWRRLKVFTRSSNFDQVASELLRNVKWLHWRIIKTKPIEEWLWWHNWKSQAMCEWIWKETTESEKSIVGRISKELHLFKVRWSGAIQTHLGRGDLGNSLARSFEAGKIHLVLDDNASGVAVVMELVSQNFQNTHGKKVSFALWSGRNWAFDQNPTWKLKRKNPPKAYINLDMGDVFVTNCRFRVWDHPRYDVLHWRASSKYSDNLGFGKDPYQPTDSMAFIYQKFLAWVFSQELIRNIILQEICPPPISTVGLVQGCKICWVLRAKQSRPEYSFLFRSEGSRKILRDENFVCI